MSELQERCRLYLISPEKFELNDFSKNLEKALAAGDVASFQLRMKDQPDELICVAAEKLIPI